MTYDQNNKAIGITTAAPAAPTVRLITAHYRLISSSTSNTHPIKLLTTLSIIRMDIEHDVRLPTELWRYIIQLAASEPNEVFDTCPQQPNTESVLRKWPTSAGLFYTTKEKAEYWTRMQLKMAVSLVSKSWRSLSIDLLYEHVTFRTRHAFLLFLRILEDDWKRVERHNRLTDQSSQLHHIGSFVKRLFLLYPKEDSYAKIPTTSYSFGNLEILAAWRPPDDPDITVLLNTILRESSSSLRYIGYIEREDLQTVPVNLQSCSALEIFCLLYTGYKQVDYTQFSPVSLPRLHTLEIGQGNAKGIFKWLSRCSMPSLRGVQIGPLTYELADDVVQFYRLFGPNLRILHLGWSTPHNLNVLLDLCPSLQSLTLDYRALEDGQEADLSLPSVERIGITIEPSLFEQAQGDIYALDDIMIDISVFISVLIQIPARAQTLKCVRFSDFSLHDFEEQIWMSSHIDLWEEWIDAWKSGGIRFEFCSGDLVEIPHDVQIVEDEAEAFYSRHPEFGRGAEVEPFPLGDSEDT
jgi:hypothetical protein